MLRVSSVTWEAMACTQALPVRSVSTDFDHARPEVLEQQEEAAEDAVAKAVINGPGVERVQCRVGQTAEKDRGGDRGRSGAGSGEAGSRR